MHTHIYNTRARTHAHTTAIQAVRYSQRLPFMEDAYAQDTDFFQALTCGDLNKHATAPIAFALTNQNLFRMLEANPLCVVPWWCQCVRDRVQVEEQEEWE